MASLISLVVDEPFKSAVRTFPSFSTATLSVSDMDYSPFGFQKPDKGESELVKSVKGFWGLVHGKISLYGLQLCL
jgi:hypothetical protein